MAVRRLYLQQISYDGSTYTKGDLLDTYEYNIGIKEIPFKYLPEFKDVTKRDWAGEDGVDVYIPTQRRFKEYDIEVEFIYKGTYKTIHDDLRDFLDFFRHKGSGGKILESRFVMYDDHTQIGRKDVICNTNFSDVDLFYYEDFDNESIASFKLKFTVCDPTTEVTPLINMQDIVYGFTW